MNCYLACVAVVSCFLAVASGQHFVSDYEQSHWRDACFCLGFNPDEHRQAAECMYAIIYSAENYLSDGHGDLITHLFNARTLLHDFLHEDGHGHGGDSHDHDSHEFIDFWPSLHETTCTADSVEGFLVVESMYGMGTVCDDGFEYIEATVFCQTLGFEYGEYQTRNGEHLGYSIVLDDVRCMEGDHTSMCSHIGWGEHNCGHHEDVYLMCFYPHEPEMMMYMCDNHGDGSWEDVYFWPSLGDITCGGEDFVDGLVLVDVDGHLGTVCANNFGYNEARAVCLNHGFMEGEPIYRDGSMSGFEQVASGMACPEFEDWADFHQCQLNRRYEEGCYGNDAGVHCFNPQYEGAGLYVYDNIHHNNPCQPEVYWPSLGDIQCMDDDGNGNTDSIEALVIVHSNMDYERRGTVCFEGVTHEVAMAICSNHGFSHGEVITRDGMQWEMEQVIGGYACPEPEYHEPYMSHMPYEPYGMEPDMAAEMPMPYYHLDFGRCDTYETHAACYGMDAGVRCSNPRHPRETEHVWDQLTETNPCMQERFYPNLGDLECSEASYGTVSGILVGTSNIDYQSRGTYCADSFGYNEAVAVCKSFGYGHGEVASLDASQWELEMVSGGYICPEVDYEREYFDMYECTNLPLPPVCEMGPVAVRCAEPYYENNAVYTYDILNERNTCQYGDNPGLEVDLMEPVCGANTVEGLLVVRNLAVSDDWGTVCDDAFSNIDAEVVCRQMGFFGGEEFDHNGEHTGLDIKLDDVECEGHELSLGECQAQIFGTHNCGHYEDVGVRCYFEVAAPEALCPIM